MPSQYIGDSEGNIYESDFHAMMKIPVGAYDHPVIAQHTSPTEETKPDYSNRIQVYRGAPPVSEANNNSVKRDDYGDSPLNSLGREGVPEPGKEMTPLDSGMVWNRYSGPRGALHGPPYYEEPSLHDQLKSQEKEFEGNLNQTVPSWDQKDMLADSEQIKLRWPWSRKNESSEMLSPGSGGELNPYRGSTEPRVNNRMQVPGYDPQDFQNRYGPMNNNRMGVITPIQYNPQTEHAHPMDPNQPVLNNRADLPTNAREIYEDQLRLGKSPEQARDFVRGLQKRTREQLPGENTDPEDLRLQRIPQARAPDGTPIQQAADKKDFDINDPMSTHPDNRIPGDYMEHIPGQPGFAAESRWKTLDIIRNDHKSGNRVDFDPTTIGPNFKELLNNLPNDIEHIPVNKNRSILRLRPSLTSEDNTIPPNARAVEGQGQQAPHTVFLTAEDKMPEKKADLEKFIRDKLQPIMPEGSGKVELDRTVLEAARLIGDSKTASFVPQPTGDWKMDVLNAVQFALLGLGGGRIPRNQRPSAYIRNELGAEFQKDPTPERFQQERFYDRATAARRNELILGVKPQGDIPPLDIPPRGTPEYERFDSVRESINAGRTRTARISQEAWENMSHEGRVELAIRRDAQIERDYQRALEENNTRSQVPNAEDGSQPRGQPRSRTQSYNEETGRWENDNRSSAIHPDENFTPHYPRVEPAGGPYEQIPFGTDGINAIRFQDMPSWLRENPSPTNRNNGYQRYIQARREAMEGERTLINNRREQAGFDPITPERYGHMQQAYRQDLLNSPTGVVGARGALREAARRMGSNTPLETPTMTRTMHYKPIKPEYEGKLLKHTEGSSDNYGEYHRFVFDTPKGPAPLSAVKVGTHVDIPMMGLRIRRENENIVGPVQMRKILKELMEYFPDMKTLSGFRVGGAQTGASRPKVLKIPGR